MTGFADRYVPCPGCDAAIRPLDGSGCPKCGCCLRCGRNVPEDWSYCSCISDDSADPDWEALLSQAIPESDVPREFARMEIRRQLETQKAIVSAVIGASIIALGTVGQFKQRGPDWVSLAFTFAGIVIGIWVSNRLFSWIENRALAREFSTVDSKS